MFLREHRHELFDAEFQQAFEAMYRSTGAGKEPVCPTLLAMALLVQGYLRVSDAEAVGLSVVDLRWRMVLDRLQIAARSSTRRQRLSVALWYGQRDLEIEMCSDTAVWFHSGMTPVPIRRVLIRDPESGFLTQALLSTAMTAESGDIVRWFVQRWQVEVMFEEVRRHLGVETQRQRSQSPGYGLPAGQEVAWT